MHDLLPGPFQMREQQHKSHPVLITFMCTHSIVGSLWLWHVYWSPHAEAGQKGTCPKHHIDWELHQADETENWIALALKNAPCFLLARLDRLYHLPFFINLSFTCANYDVAQIIIHPCMKSWKKYLIMDTMNSWIFITVRFTCSRTVCRLVNVTAHFY
jgi:hypothetical protein